MSALALATAPMPHILVVDDDVTQLGVLSWLLKEQGYDVATATGGEGMLERMAQRVPDLLLLDIMMPDRDGIQLLEQLQRDERWRDVPVVMLSAAPPEEASVRSLALGATDFVRKPFKVRELLARIAAHLRAQGRLREAREELHRLESALIEAREDAESRRKLVDILHEVTGELSAEEIYRILARRVARALGISHCSVVLARAGDEMGVVAAAHENPALRNLQIRLENYPEIRAALDGEATVLVEDVRSHPLYADIRRTWAESGTQVPIRSIVAIPFALDRMQTGVFFLRTSHDEPPLSHEDADFADTVIKAAVAAVRRARIIETTQADNARLEAMATTDPLTHLSNRRALLDRLAIELDRARRYGTVVSLLMLDVDHFKRINDTHGHLVGDDVLREMGGVLQHAVRAVDVVARFGGEEFVVVLPETGPEGAVAFAERLREKIESHVFRHGESVTPRLTASIGVASYPGLRVETTDDLIARADEALYRAKTDGRNRVCL